MYKLTYRFLILLLIFSSCKKEEGYNPPRLSVITESGFISADATLSIGKPYKIGFNAIAGDAPITNLKITLSTENGDEVALDSGIYSKNVYFEKSNFYGATTYEKWTFFIRDKNGLSASVTINLNKDLNSNFGLISYFPSIIMGLQNYSAGSFLNPANGLIYKSDSALINQNLIYIITYWGEFNSPPTQVTFSSPTDNDVAIYFPFINDFILPKNEVRYKADSLSIGTQAFDDAYNDSLIISNYTAATAGKRKFKSAISGYVIPFQITTGLLAGKRGLIKVKTINSGSNGCVEFALKIQK